jgi:hypothetical protein
MERDPYRVVVCSKDLQARLKTCECEADWVNLIWLSYAEPKDMARVEATLCIQLNIMKLLQRYTVAFIKHFSIIIIPREISAGKHNRANLANLFSNKQVLTFYHCNKQKMRALLLWESIYRLFTGITLMGFSFPAMITFFTELSARFSYNLFKSMENLQRRRGKTPTDCRL